MKTPIDEKRAARLAAALGEVPDQVPALYDVNAHPKPVKKPVVIRQKKGESTEEAIARAALSPAYTGSLTARRFSGSVTDEVDATAAATVFLNTLARLRVNDMGGMEDILAAQAIALNCIFTEMAGRASAALKTDLARTEGYMRMALRAQANCRATIETLAEVKNPRATTFVRQQNNAHQQQVNNGESAPAVEERAPGEKTPNAPNKLLEAPHGKRLDSRAAGTAGGSNQTLAAVEQVDRSEDGAGKSRRPRKRPAARAEIGGVLG